MSVGSFDWTQIQKKAQKPPDTDLGIVQSWWSNKYNRPGNDPLFMSRPFALHVREFLTDLVDMAQTIQEQLKLAPTREEEQDMRERLDTINTVLGIKSTSLRTWQEEVEVALADGRLPDWEA
jgi:hypothetical protein